MLYLISKDAVLYDQKQGRTQDFLTGGGGGGSGLSLGGMVRQFQICFEIFRDMFFFLKIKTNR